MGRCRWRGLTSGSLEVRVTLLRLCSVVEGRAVGVFFATVASRVCDLMFVLALP